MNLRSTEPPTVWIGRIGAMAVLVVLSLATLVVWWNEIQHDQRAIRNHSKEVSRQAARRLQTMMDGRLTSVMVFARGWRWHEQGGRLRFEQLAGDLVAQVPGIHSVRFVSGDGKPAWLAPSRARSAWGEALRAQPDLLEPPASSDIIMLSAPVNLGEGTRRFFAVFFLSGPNARLVVEFDSETLFSHVFLNKIRDDFEFEVFDADGPVFQFTPEGPTGTHQNRDFGATWEFAMLNRTWQFQVVPRQKTAAEALGLGSWPILVLGLLLSAGLAAMVNLLARRVEAFRVAHDKALSEIAERKRIEEQLRASEERYRSVFASATDGLLLIDDEDRIVQANPAACLMHGERPGALDGMSLFDLISPASRHLYASFKQHPEGLSMVRADVVHHRADGSLIDVEARASSFHMMSGRRTLAILTDVTERRRAVRRLAMLSRKALMAQEDERARVSRDLHDELGQLLTASRFELGWLQKHAADLPDEVSNALARAIEGVEKSADELRRICRGLRPPLLDDLGLEPAVHALVREFEERTRLNIEIQVDIDERADIAREVALCTYRVLQESLNNIGRHAQAERVDVNLVGDLKQVELIVRDDGCGFDVENPAAPGVGIEGMRERAILVGGTVEIRSVPSDGTRVTLTIPLNDSQQELQE